MSWSWPDNWPVEWPQGISADQMTAQTKDTRAFVDFYKDITRTIENKISSRAISDD